MNKKTIDKLKNGGGQAAGHDGHAHAEGGLPRDEQVAAEEVAQSEAADAGHAKAEATITTEHKRGLAKPRDGYEAHTEGIFQLYEENPKELGTSIDTQGLRKEQDVSVAQAKEVERLEQARRQAAGRRMQAASMVWDGMMEIYHKALASKTLRTHPTVVALERFLKLGPRTKPNADQNKKTG